MWRSAAKVWPWRASAPAKPADTPGHAADAPAAAAAGACERALDDDDGAECGAAAPRRPSRLSVLRQACQAAAMRPGAHNKLALSLFGSETG